MELINKILESLNGFNFWWAVILSLVGYAGFYFLSKETKEEKRIAKRQLLFLALIALLIVSGIVFRHLIVSSPYVFHENVAGILVLQIKGDDESHSLQRDVIATLNTKISKLTQKSDFPKKIGVRSYDHEVSDLMGLNDAHEKARQYGEKSKALMVIWGDKVAQNKFHPRITIIGTAPVQVGQEISMVVQNITKLGFPSELVKESVFLTHFVAGYLFYKEKHYGPALTHFETALEEPVTDPSRLNSLRYYAAHCHSFLSKGQTEKASQLFTAIEYYTKIIDSIAKAEFPEIWATSYVSLGVAFTNLPSSEKLNLLGKAIACFDSAMLVINETEFPRDWAWVQNNKGVTYSKLASIKNGGNLTKAINTYSYALRVYTEETYPEDWARIQNNLGVVYKKIQSGDRDQNLKKAIDYYNSALRVYTKERLPWDWANTQNNLAIAYSYLPSGVRQENLRVAIEIHNLALKVLTETEFPFDWARVQLGLGNAYRGVPSGDRRGDLCQAINFFNAALRVFCKEHFPEDWAGTQLSLGNIYLSFSAEEGDDYLIIAIAAYDSSQSVFTEEKFPLKWADIQNGLGLSYKNLSSGNRLDNLKKAISFFENALLVFTPDGVPRSNQMVTENLKKAKNLLHKTTLK